MSTSVTYYPGGFIPGSAAQNRAEQWDSGTGLYSAWSAEGVQTVQRPLTTAEAAQLADVDTASVRDGNRLSMQAKAAAALTANAAFLAIASPTTVQNATQVQRLTRESNAMIRLVLGLLDDTAGT